jgi:rhamnose utilization protein RhaD (predicted bifunctional aldolase and dehydrogenase)
MMSSGWDDAEAARLVAGTQCEADRALILRLYSSRLIGADPDLVLHGGGNTSVKVSRNRVDGTPVEVLHVKGSGHDLADIDASGMPAVYLLPLEAYRRLDTLDDVEMVAGLRKNLVDPSAPTPSIEALLHAYLPGKYVDHTHATAALVVANQPNAAELASRIFGDRLVVIPYVMPGFDLSIAGDRGFRIGPHGAFGLFLVNHGLFTQGKTAKRSYDRMIDCVLLITDYLAERGVVIPLPESHDNGADDRARRMGARLQHALLARSKGGVALEAIDFRRTPSIVAYSELHDLAEISSRGAATPDHVIRTKPFPLIAFETWDQTRLDVALDDYARRYRAYFDRNARLSAEPKTMLDPLPRVVLVPGLGVFGLGESKKTAAIVSDIAEQTARIVLAAEALGRYTPLAEAELFRMEYWSLEQAKLRKP